MPWAVEVRMRINWYSLGMTAKHEGAEGDDYLFWMLAAAGFVFGLISFVMLAAVGRLVM